MNQRWVVVVLLFFFVVFKDGFGNFWVFCVVVFFGNCSLFFCVCLDFITYIDVHPEGILDN